VEHSGILNLGIEGTMIMGAFFGFFGMYNTNSQLLGIGMAMLAGMFMGLILVFLASSLKVNQAVAGISLNLFASGLTFYLYRLSVLTDVSEALPTIQILDFFKIPLLSKIPIIGEVLFNHQILTYVVYLLVPVIWFFLYKTKYGLILRGIGENPRAIDMKGIHITRIQYLSVIFGGMMAALGGAYLTMASSGLFLSGMTGGRGWLALVIVIAGNWKPDRIVIAALIFGFLEALQTQLQAIGVSFPYQILLGLPYAVAILMLITTSRLRAEPPQSLGIPYERE
jgi:simple sugar transport system permease protein